MTSHCPRRILPPGGTRKRKEREAPCFPSGPPATTTSAPTTTAYSANAREAGEARPTSSNRLLAGYMAHEFLTRGTLFGQKWDSGGTEAVNSSSSASAQPIVTRKDDNSHAEMARIVKSDGTHIPGVVNPSQLSRWMQI